MIRYRRFHDYWDKLFAWTHHYYRSGSILLSNCSKEDEYSRGDTGEFDVLFWEGKEVSGDGWGGMYVWGEVDGGLWCDA